MDDEEYQTPFSPKFVDKLLIDGMLNSDVRSIAGLPVGYEDIMRLAIDYSDAVVINAPTINTRVQNYLHNTGKITLPYMEDNKEEFLAFCNLKILFAITLSAL